MPTTRCVCMSHSGKVLESPPDTTSGHASYAALRPGFPAAGPDPPRRKRACDAGPPGHSHDKPERQGQQGRPRFSSGQLCWARVLDTRVERTFLCGDGERDSRVRFPKASRASQSRRCFRGPSRASSGSQLPSPETRLFPLSCKTGSLGVMSRN